MTDSEQPDSNSLSAETVRAAMDEMMTINISPSRIDPYTEALITRARLQAPDEFQRLVDESVLAGEHVHTWRDGELRCVMGECD